MKSAFRCIGTWLLAGALWCRLAAMALPAGAQSLRDVRVDPYPPGTQVGILTDISGRTAWIRFPDPLPTNARVDISAYSEGADVLAMGRVRWVSPVAPYDAYVVDIRTVTTSHDINPDEDLFVIGPLFKAKKSFGEIPVTEPYGVPIATGFFARTAVARPPAAVVEPVRTLIGALRAQRSPAANAIADAAQRALGPDPLAADTDIPAEEAVNYTQLADNLRRFHRLQIADPITKHILDRLDRIVRANAGAGARVSKDMLRVTPPLMEQGTSFGPGTVR